MIATESSQHSSAHSINRLLILLLSAFMLTACSTLKEAYDSAFPETEIESETSKIQGEQLDSDDLNTLINQPYIDPLTRFIGRHDNNNDMASQVEVAYAEQQKRCNQATDRLIANTPDANQVARFIRGYQYSCPNQVERIKTQFQGNETTAEVTWNPGQIDNANSLREQDADQVSDCYLLLSIKNYTEAKSVCLPLIERGDLTAIEGIAEVAYMEEDYDNAVRLAEPVANQSALLSFLMGQMYESGHGVDLSLASARDWYLQAKQLGHTDADRALSNLNNR